MLSPETRSRILELADGSRTGGQIAAEVGVSRNVVIGLVHRNNEALDRGRITGKPASLSSQHVNHGHGGGRPRKPRPEPGLPPAPRKAQKPSGPPLEPRPRALDEDPGTPPPEVEPDAPIGPTASLMDLGYRRCRHPLWSGEVPRAEDLAYCGRKPAGNGVYCETHRRVNYQPLVPRRLRIAVERPESR